MATIRKEHLKAIQLLDRAKSAATRQLIALYGEAADDLINASLKYFSTNTSIQANFRNTIDRWSTSVAGARNAIIEDSLLKSAAAADALLRAAAKAQYGFVPQALIAEQRLRAAQLMQQVRQLLSAPKGSEMTALSKNWFKWGYSHKNGRKNLLNALTRNIGIFEDAVKAGNNIYTRNAIRPGSLPKYLREIADLAKQARVNGLHEFKDELYRLNKRVEKLGRTGIEWLGKGKGQTTQLTTRGFKKRFLKSLEIAVRNGSDKQIKAAITKYSERQAIYNARVLQRSATNMLFQQRMIDRAKESPFIEGLQWTLAPVRNFEDICDDYATDDTDGLGAGVFKPGNTPSYPHYNCACSLYPVLVPVGTYWDKYAEQEIEANVKAA